MSFLSWDIVGEVLQMKRKAEQFCLGHLKKKQVNI
jgi:hypothetical protein